MGRLVLLTTPIGNIGDISSRVKQCLSEQKTFYVEDTRVFRKLLAALNFEVKGYQLFSFHEHSKEKIEGLVDKIKSGETIYLASDAGSPIISDPAYPLVKRCEEEGVRIETLPGVSSLTVALELSGLPPIPFKFWGFLDREKRSKTEAFEKLEPKVSHFFFESPHRIEETLKLLKEKFPMYQVAVLRELTKKFESVHRFQAGQYSESLGVTFKGEFVLGLYHEDVHRVEIQSIDSKKVKELAEGYLKKSSTKNLSKLLASCLGMGSKEVYEKLNLK